MSQHARVNSVVTLKELRSALAAFSETASVALDEVSSEIQRTLAWLNEDRRRHWKNEVRLRTEQQVQAKLALKRKGVFDLALTGGRTSAIDEKKALARAERRLQEARRRLARTQSWIQRIDKELSDYRAACAGLTGAIDADIPNARARLEKMVESLEAYVALAPPEAVASAGLEDRDGVLRPVEGEPTVLRTTGDSSALEAAARALRQRTPSADVRERTAFNCEAVEWIAKLKLSEALGQADIGEGAVSMESQPDEKVLVALPQGDPGVVYLERTTGGDGDSGWYVGTDDIGREYAAVHVRDLLTACPGLTNILCWPMGYLVLVDTTNETEAVFDTQDTLVWRNTRSDNGDPAV
jgi:hypothetical protein